MRLGTNDDAVGAEIDGRAGLSTVRNPKSKNDWSLHSFGPQLGDTRGVARVERGARASEARRRLEHDVSVRQARSGDVG